MKQQINSESSNTATSISEQIKLAAQLHEKDAKQLQATQERLAATRAAEEMGIPSVYMEQAAAEITARQAAKARQRKRRQAGGVFGLAAVIAASGAWGVSHRSLAPPPPLVYNFAALNQGQWHLDTDQGPHPDHQVSLSFPQEQGQAVALIKVNNSSQYPDNQIDLDTNQIPRPLTGYRTVSFRVRGQGIGQIRLFLQNGSERWCSPFLTASGPWHEVRVPLSHFLHQNVPPQYNPQDAPYVAPTTIGKISFKLGRDANPEDAHGEVAVDDLQFK